MANVAIIEVTNLKKIIWHAGCAEADYISSK